MRNNGCNTHVVVKAEDIENYLDIAERSRFAELLEKIEGGRRVYGKKTGNTYYICNTDEPYAELVHGIILGGEAVKNR